jgi:hypothetical protein
MGLANYCSGADKGPHINRAIEVPTAVLKDYKFLATPHRERIVGAISGFASVLGSTCLVLLFSTPPCGTEWISVLCVLKFPLYVF